MLVDRCYRRKLSMQTGMVRGCVVLWPRPPWPPMTVSALPSARMGITLSRSTPWEHVAPYLSVARLERWPR
jgi:hypothetical protein